MSEAEKDITIVQGAVVQFAGNTFDDVPVILQYESTPLLWLADAVSGRLESRAKVYNRDGVYIAKLRGRRLDRTMDGEKSNIEVRHGDGLLALLLDGAPLAEFRRTSPALLEVQTELYSPTGVLLVGRPTPASGAAAQVLNRVVIPVRGLTFQMWMVGVHVAASGLVTLGANFDSVFDDPMDKPMSRLGHDGKPID